MPFTLSHAAAALPLTRLSSRLPLAALVIGTMAPDFEYLLRLATRGTFAHTPLGIVAFCLPASIMVYLVFDSIVRPALLPMMPPGIAAALRQRPSPMPSRSARAVSIVIAILLGAVSHVVWDGFTHGRGWAVVWLPILRQPVGPGLLSFLPWFAFLQYVSTLLGAIVLAIWIGVWLHRRPLADRAFRPGQLGRTVWTCAFILLIALIAGIANALRAGGYPPAVVLGFAAVGWLNGLAVALLVFGLTATRRDLGARPG